MATAKKLSRDLLHSPNRLRETEWRIGLPIPVITHVIWLYLVLAISDGCGAFFQWVKPVRLLRSPRQPVAKGCPRLNGLSVLLGAINGSRNERPAFFSTHPVRACLPQCTYPCLLGCD